ncbi:DUF6305 family protein [Wukongibacter sp. M2B1]|uniref:DUF6305 family protein n=1 Tax=Wukongibacter sp. M2B1 TaxID=3088895 RepID=UPI003D7A5C8A
MKKKAIIKNIFLVILGAVMTFSIINWFKLLSYKEHKTNIYLTQSIASEKILITSAGQSTDTYIIKNIANELMLHNYFMPKAERVDLELVHSIVIVVGYSTIGEMLNDSSYKDEVIRIEKFIESVQAADMPIIMVYIGGKARRNSKTDYFLKRVGEASSFIISTHDGDYDEFISSISSEKGIPLSLVGDIQEIKAPFASLYR